MRYGVRFPPHSIFCGNLNVCAFLKRKEWSCGHESFIDVRGDLCVDISTLGFMRIGPGTIEIWGELSPHCEDFNPGEQLDAVWIDRGFWYGDGKLIEVRLDLSVDVCNLGLNRIGRGVVEIWGEVFPPQYNLRNMIGLGFVEGEGVVVWSWNFDRRQKGPICGCYPPWFEENWSRGT